MVKYLDYSGLSYLWTKIAISINNAVNNEASIRLDADNALSTRITSNTTDISRLNTRMSTIEELSTITLDGGNITIGTSADFINRTTAGDAKIPTVGAVADSADAIPTENSNNFVTSGGVYEAIPKMVYLTQEQYDALTNAQKLNGSWYFIKEE